MSKRSVELLLEDMSEAAEKIRRYTGGMTRADFLADEKTADAVVRNLKVVLEPSDEGGFTALVPALPGCISEGDTREKALENIREAIALYLEPIDDDASFSPEAELVEVAV